jgi:pectin methylesterase-like acyl-CoA thioesterase
MGKAQTGNIITVPDDYPTINAAIGNATSGDTIFIKAGIYNESSLVINEKVSLVGEDANKTIIVNNDQPYWNMTTSMFPPYTTAIDIRSAEVKILNLTISGADVGIHGTYYTDKLNYWQ